MTLSYNTIATCVLLSCCITLSTPSTAQTTQAAPAVLDTKSGLDLDRYSRPGSMSLGIGFGLPYGGLIGLRLGVRPWDHGYINAGAGLFAGSIGYNFGLRQAFDSRSRTQFYVMGNYGTNAAIIDKNIGRPNDTELFGGFSFGAGIKIRSIKRPGGHWDIGLLIPIHSSKFEDSIEPYHDVTDPPVGITFGYFFK